MLTDPTTDPTSTSTMGRPRDPNVPTRLGTCKIHGEILHRGYSNGRRDGTKIRYRCPACDTARKTTRTATEKS